MSNKLIDCIPLLLKTGDSKKDNVVVFLEENIMQCLQTIDITFDNVVMELSEFSFVLSQDSLIDWKVICIGCYLLLQIAEPQHRNDDVMFSISQKKYLERLIQFIMHHGVHPSLLPGVGISDKIIQPPKIQDFEKYRRLKSVCKFINKIHSSDDFKSILSSYYFGDYLAALHQLSYAPLVKPSTVLADDQPLVITKEMWEKLNDEQKDFKNILEEIIDKTYQPALIKELLVLQGVKSHPLPNFMRKALTKELSLCLTRPGGLLAVIHCFLDSHEIDIGSQWKSIEMITKLISVKHGTLSTDEYLLNICNQLSNILDEDSKNSYIIIAAACTKSLYEKFNTNENILRLINKILSPFSDLDSQFSCDHSSSDIYAAINRIDLCFCHPKLSLPISFLTSIIHCLFSLRICLKEDSNSSSKLDNLISKHFSSKVVNNDVWFNAVLLANECGEIPIKFAKFDITEKNSIHKTKSGKHEVNFAESMDTLMNIIEKPLHEVIFAWSLFAFLLNLTEKELPVQKATTALNSQNNLESKSKLLSIMKRLEILSSKQSVLKNFKTNPDIVLDFIKRNLQRYSNNISISDECLTISLVLLSTLLSDSAFDRNKILDTVDSLKIIIEVSSDESIKFLGTEILNLLTPNTSKSSCNKSMFDEAINQICDPLLPVRAHGLMELTKLIENEDIETISKKEFVLCIFQENLKDADSYVYLTAINGLAKLAKIIPEDILEVLSKEYLNESNKKTFTSQCEEENLKLRMKIGEILLRVTKNLGTKAMDHKVILLNTFLGGCHDIDNIMRASSLSNLAELCQVLSYKLGELIFDILKLVDSILQGDKSVECRRAAVLVISSIIKGLGKESLLFLREALIPMYRTLKKLYSDEKEDSAVRLHAQLALEELNEIMMEIMAPYLKPKI